MTRQRTDQTNRTGARRVLVLEPNATGHHGVYLNWIVRGMLSRGLHVGVVSTGKALSHPSLEDLAHHHGESLTFYTNVTAPASVRRLSSIGLVHSELAHWALFRNWYRTVAPRLQPDLVLLPYLDYCLYAVGLLGSPFGSTSWAGLAMRPSFHYQSSGVIAPQPTQSLLKRRLFQRAIKQRSLRALFTTDEPLARYMERTRTRRIVYLLPEPINIGAKMDKAEARRSLNLPRPGKLVLLYGQVDHRKGLRELLLAAQSPKFPTETSIVVAGSVTESAKILLRQPWVKSLLQDSRVFVLDHFLDAGEERAVFSAADVVWLGYRGHYVSSGVLGQAGRMGIPVLACPEGVIGWTTRKYGLGLCVPPSDSDAVGSALTELTADTEATRTMALNGKEAFARHTVDDAIDVLSVAWA